MSAFGMQESCTRLFLLRCLVLMFLMVIVCVKPAGAESPSDSIDWLWKTFPDEARIDLRIISVDAAGKRQLAEVALQYWHRRDESYVTAATKVKDYPARVFCLRCDVTGGLNSCEVQAGSFPELRDEFVPGTLMPWRVMLIGFCRHFRAFKLEPLSDLKRDVVELLPLVPNGGVPEFRLRVFVSKASQLPEEVVYLDELGREKAMVEILKTCKTKWGRVVTRSVYRDLIIGTRVLVEVRGGSWNKQDEQKTNSR